MAKRVAFLIGNQRFRRDSGLLPLQGPTNDVAALARLLRDPKRGRFDKVHEFLDKSCHEILPDLAHALGEAAPGDLFLIYYSGHGKLDRQGRLCLATADTRQGALVATSIPARQLRDLVEESDCDQVVMLLDCCYSGAVGDGLKGDVDSALHAVENARGFYIMTASTGLQAARETQVTSGGVVMGRFTAALVDGIANGTADLGHKGKILLSDLRQHLGRVVKGQTPQFFDSKAVGDPLISLSPTTATPLLNPLVLANLDAGQLQLRHDAVSTLSDILRAGTQATKLTAESALRRRLEQEHDADLRERISFILSSEEKSELKKPSVALWYLDPNIFILCIGFALLVAASNLMSWELPNSTRDPTKKIIAAAIVAGSTTALPIMFGIIVADRVRDSEKRGYKVCSLFALFLSTIEALARRYFVYNPQGPEADPTVWAIFMFYNFIASMLGTRLRYFLIWMFKK